MCLHQLIWHVGIRTRRWLHSLASLHIKLAQYPLYLPDIQQNKTKELANFLTTNLLLPLYGHFLIQSIPNSGYRVLSSDSQKNIGKGENKPLTVKSFIVTSILDNSLFFFCPGTKCAKDIIWIYHKINCFFLKTEVSLKRLVGWIEFIYLVHNSRFRLSESIQTDCISQLIFSEIRKLKKTNYLSCQKNVRVSVRKRKKIIMQSKLSCSVWINDETIKMSIYPLLFIIVSWKCNSDIQLLSRLI